MKLHDYSRIAIDQTGQMFAGISWFPTPTEIFGTDAPLQTTILDSEDFRPDKIAKRLWGAPDLSWVLDVLNGFTNGISEYSRKTVILYVPLKRMHTIGLI